MKRWLIASTMIALLTMASMTAAYADCVRGGVVYPEGTLLGGMVCVGGKWIKR